MKKICALVTVLIIIGFGWYKLSLRPVDASGDARVPVQVRPGYSVNDIGQLLKMKGLIRSPLAFSLYARLHRAQTSLQAGDFSLQPSMTTPQVIEALKRGFSQEAAITIPEGFTVKDIDALLTNKGLITAGAFSACARTCDLSAYDFLPKTAGTTRGGRVEGYLFPDTYLVFSQNFEPKDFLDRLLSTFKKRVITGLADDLKTSKHPLHEIVTMASLIEEETKTDDERPVVSGILWKRFEANQGLGVDATVRYILEKPSAAITAKDLDVDSPYNLRKYRGLPPGPIASPGLSSIKAALHPADLKYWYYLHGKDGVIRYGETNDEHNRNKQLYLR